MCGTTARLASAVGVLSLVLFTAALIVFPALPTTGAGLLAGQDRITVDRTHKGDRLPSVKPANGAEELAGAAAIASAPAVPGENSDRV